MNFGQTHNNNCELIREKKYQTEMFASDKTNDTDTIIIIPCRRLMIFIWVMMIKRLKESHSFIQMVGLLTMKIYYINAVNIIK